MAQIKNYNMYFKNMGKSILDKAFFIDKIFDPVDKIVDFGCANGELIKFLQTLDDNYEYIGYDNNPDMIKAAKENVSNAHFTSSWEEILDNCGPNTLLNLSSVIHEVYSYLSEEEIEAFWNKVFNNGFKYICIRDMMVAKSEDFNLVAPNCIRNIVEKSHISTQKLDDFEKHWGKIETYNQLLHFLLKYQWSDNWDREVRENYFGLSYEDFEEIIALSGYEIVYLDRFTLPYLKWSAKKDFDIDLYVNRPTHIKCILKRID